MLREILPDNSPLKFMMKGQTLIEVLVALGIITVVVTALVSVVITSLSNTQYSKSQSQASQFAQEGMEVMRQWRDSDYAGFRNTPSGIYCLAAGSTVLNSNCPLAANVGIIFLRQVKLAQSGCSANVTSVEVSVAWQDSKCSISNLFCHNAKLSTCLSAVNPVPNF